MLNECNGCEYQCNLSHIDICTLGSPCPNQRSTPMTNEEWLHTLNTEQLAEWMAKEKLCNCYFIFPSMEEAIQDAMEWLKQPHTINE